MPNWCENTLTVTGSQDQVDTFVRRAEGAHAHYVDETGRADHNGRLWPLSFHALVPVPDDVLQAGYVDAGYTWQREHYGTKWEPEEIQLERGDGVAVYTFLTAWSPPIPWLETVAGKFPDLKLRLTYDEPGMGIFGEVAYADGKPVETRHT